MVTNTCGTVGRQQGTHGTAPAVAGERNLWLSAKESVLEEPEAGVVTLPR